MSIPSPETLVGRARELAPGIAARAAATEQLNRLPDESFAEFRDAGLFRVMQPRRYGGYEYGVDVLFDVTREIGRSGCGSSAWVLGILGIHNFFLAYLDPRAQDEIWADPDTQVSTPFNPSGTLRPVAGGYELADGRWPFASGVDHCQYALVGAHRHDPAGGPPDFVQCVIPRSDFTIDQRSWDVVGFRGTGSKDVVIERAFVPEYRVLNLTRANQAGEAPGLALNTGPLYRQSYFSTAVIPLIAPVCGLAWFAIDNFRQRLGRRTLAFGGGMQREQGSVQVLLAEAWAQSQSAELLVKHSCAEMAATAHAGRRPSMAERARHLSFGAYAVRQFTKTVEDIFTLSGGGALQLTDPLQRAWRDAHANGVHAAFSFDTMGSLHARVELDLPAPHGLL